MGLVLHCVFGEHDLYLLPVAAMLAILACSTTLAMITRARAATQMRMHAAWLTSAGMAAGTGIWATHFVAMLAYNAPFPIAFDPSLTLLSIVLAIGLCGAGFAVMLRPGLSVVGGMLAGLAISGMHYVGMAALEIPARLLWNTPMVAASVLIGASLGGLAGYFAERASSPFYRVLTILCASLAILGMHFTAMAAVHFMPDAEAAPVMRISPLALAAIVTAAAGFILAMAMILALVDAYLADRNAGESARMRAHIADLEATRSALSAALEAAEAASRSSGISGGHEP